jgi:hypothetical protein
MNDVKKGMASGFVASVALGVIMYARQVTGIPGIDPEQLMTSGFSRLGMQINPTTGWMAHLLIGTIVWGWLFGYLNNEIPLNNEIFKGMLFSMFTWLLMIVFLLPLARLGTNAFDNTGTISITLVMHLIFGAFLGASYAAFGSARASAPALR